MTSIKGKDPVLMPRQKAESIPFCLAGLLAKPVARQLGHFWKLWQLHPSWPNRSQLTEQIQSRYQSCYGSSLDLQFGIPSNFGKRRRQSLKRLSTAAFLKAQHEARYETHIFEQQTIPHRQENWHDFMNAAIWYLFPLSKLELHRQAYLLRKATAQLCPPAMPLEGRSRELDQLTCLDEAGVILIVPRSEQEQAHRQLSNRDLAIKSAWLRDCPWELLVFGHGIWEELQRGMRPIQVMAFILPWDQSYPSPEWHESQFIALDRQLAHHLACTFDETQPLKPFHSRLFGSLPLSEFRSISMEKTGQIG